MIISVGKIRNNLYTCASGVLKAHNTRGFRVRYFLSVSVKTLVRVEGKKHYPLYIGSV